MDDLGLGTKGCCIASCTAQPANAEIHNIPLEKKRGRHFDGDSVIIGRQRPVVHW